MTFDTPIDRRGTRSLKWDAMETRYGVSAEDGIAMWVADMDFRSPDCVIDALRQMADFGVFGYQNAALDLHDAVAWWMETRHGWQIDPSWVTEAHGLVNATSLCLETWTSPGDHVVLFSPVYHAFARVIKDSGRHVTECPLVLEDGRFALDFASYDACMTGRETMLILCSPHNPGGRVWSDDELREIAQFARRHDLILVSDDIHQDIVFPGHSYTPMPVVAPDILDRLVMLTAASKTFNIAGLHIGNVTIPDPTLRKQYRKTSTALGIAPNSAGVAMATAAYSPEGALWVDDLVAYLEGNRQVFDAGINAIPGLKAMPLEATYLAWVDFSGTGMEAAEFTRRVNDVARIAVNLGPTFGTGGAGGLRFNIGTQRAVIEEAVRRISEAFADLQ